MMQDSKEGLARRASMNSEGDSIEGVSSKDEYSADEPHGAHLHAQAALSTSSVVDLRELTVEQNGESLLISGRVHCFYHKQLAQETVRPHAANLRLVNSVSVER